MINRIYFYGTLCEIDNIPVGGGEVGNQRTINILKKNGFDLIVIRKYKLLKKHTTVYRILSSFSVLKNYIYYFYILLTGRRKNSIVHISAFYDGIMLYQEFILVLTATILGYRIVYEMRGGGADFFYKNYSIIYKSILKRTLQLSDYIFSQGKENYPLIQKLCDHPIYYYANFVETNFLPSKYPEKPSNILNILYFGRIFPEKNIETVIQSFILLKQGGYNVTLSLIGYGPQEYITKLKKIAKQDKYTNDIHFLGPCTHDKLPSLLLDKHFFIFPSEVRREGHSNALTETMCYGIIPIASKAGFNRSIINNDSLIIEKIDANIIAQKIKYIIDNKLIKNLSYQMYERVCHLYNEKEAEKQLVKEYNKLFRLFFRKNDQ